MMSEGLLVRIHLAINDSPSGEAMPYAWDGVVEHMQQTRRIDRNNNWY